MVMPSIQSSATEFKLVGRSVNFHRYWQFDWKKSANTHTHTPGAVQLWGFYSSSRVWVSLCLYIYTYISFCLYPYPASSVSECERVYIELCFTSIRLYKYDSVFYHLHCYPNRHGWTLDGDCFILENILSVEKKREEGHMNMLFKWYRIESFLWYCYKW